MRSFKHIPTGVHKKPRVVNWDFKKKWIEVAYYHKKRGNRIEFKKEKFSIPKWFIKFIEYHTDNQLHKHMAKIRDLLMINDYSE